MKCVISLHGGQGWIDYTILFFCQKLFSSFHMVQSCPWCMRDIGSVNILVYAIFPQQSWAKLPRKYGKHIWNWNSSFCIIFCVISNLKQKLKETGYLSFPVSAFLQSSPWSFSYCTVSDLMNCFLRTGRLRHTPTVWKWHISKSDRKHSHIFWNSSPSNPLLPKISTMWPGESH